MLAIYIVDKHMVFQAPKTSSKVDSIYQGTKPRAKYVHKKLLTFLKQPFVSSKEATKEFASGNDVSVVSTTETDPGKSAPSDFVPLQQGMNKGTENTSYDYLFAGTDLHALIDQTKSIGDRLETILTQPKTRKGASFIAIQVEEEEASITIKLEDLTKLVSNVQPSFKDLDSHEDDHVIVVDDSDKDEEVEVHTTTEDTSIPKSLSLREEHIKRDKVKKAMSLKDTEEVSIKSDSDDETTHVPGSMVESFKKKDFKKFDFIIEHGEHVRLSKKQISAQKKIEKEAKAKAVRRVGKIRKEELIGLLGLEMERIEYLRTTKDELGIDLDRPLSEQDPLDRLNDLENKKRKHVDDIHDFFRTNKRLKSSAQYKDHPAGTVLNESVL
nr:hypothetical protein [Tanacetum cinerariifolium]